VTARPGSASLDAAELMARARNVDQSAISPADVLLTDRVAVVTAGGGGIGQGIALGMANFGADVAVLDIDPDRCAATEAAISRTGRRGVGIICDVKDPDALTAAIEAAQERLGALDILVNNAGGVRRGSFLTMPRHSMDRHIAMNLTSVFVATQVAANSMVANGKRGTIVNVSSIEAFRAAPHRAVYAACKAGMVNFTQTMAVELGEHGIRVNGIAPDHTITPGLRDNLSGPVTPENWADTDPRLADIVPLGREGVVAECASAAVWLCAPMSDYVTGVTINVDGGTSSSIGWMRVANGWSYVPD
jgi:NAD(P)-dependent dehydrogenase (short-subunit alcohol dehydrogenase family)